MGISGLLPALKSIHVTKHLSEFEGKTIAVDAYVWLHKGIYACATELATGKSTHKYVDYVMHRVRLLRHHNITPYLVFDGGPLPAKKGTETERRQKREENRTRGNALAAQGKHTQAREHYIKCIDVTPQMAYQVIKALRAESIPYIVAPYEADAQLAYLERIGLADGILTEDSDLLVFGCRSVLFKLDSVANTVVSISRSDFGSVSETNGLSLLGWSDTQFREMAILSGCDYLPSIPGIGLKTACSLLRKWKKAEQVVRAIALEGKKSVPKGYLEQFKLAEKCFLHQRVYCPLQEKLLHLTEIDGDWEAEADSYVGGDLDYALAKKIAMGDVDPLTYLPMRDINPNFMPRAPQPLLPTTNSPRRRSKGKGKEIEKPRNGGILDFFGSNAIIPHNTEPTTTTKVPNRSGKASGKRTLADVMDHDLAQKKTKKDAPLKRDISITQLTQSKFFGTSSKLTHRKSLNDLPIAPVENEKENLCIIVDSDSEDVQSSPPNGDTLTDSDSSQLSMLVNAPYDAAIEMELEEYKAEEVEQEDGYLSPPDICSRATEELSSPPRPGSTPARPRINGTRKWREIKKPPEADTDAYFDADFVSSPVSTFKRRRRSHSPCNGVIIIQSSLATPTKGGQGIVLVQDSPRRVLGESETFAGPDLRDALGDDITSEVDCFNDHVNSKQTSVVHTCVSLAIGATPKPITTIPQTVIDVDDFEYVDLEDEQARANSVRAELVRNGWREKWAMNFGAKDRCSAVGSEGKKSGRKSTGSARPMKRSDTNVTPAGRHTLSSFDLRPPQLGPSNVANKTRHKQPRSLFLQSKS